MLNAGILRATVAAVLSFTLVACDNPIRPDDHREATGVVITDRTGNVIANTHGTGAAAHWDVAGAAHGARLHLHPGDEREIRVFFVDADGERFQLIDDPEYSLRVVFNPTGIVTYEDHGDHGDLRALAEGETTAVFQLFHGSHADWESSGLVIEVEDH